MKQLNEPPQTEQNIRNNIKKKTAVNNTAVNN